MPISKVKILCNAEAFGFGPAAAIAHLAQKLRPLTQTLSYIGEGHTLDLQKKHLYDHIYDLSDLSIEGRVEKILSVVKDYDIFVTAMDFKVAQIVKRSSCKVVVYDALAWYWDEVPDGILNADQYIAQDFIGVKERLAGLKSKLPQTLIIPPIASRNTAIPNPRRTNPDIFINFGGISNPKWGEEVGGAYVVTIAKAFGQLKQNVLCTGSVIYKKYLEDLPIATTFEPLSPHESQAAFSKAALLAITPGLGNIYEAALARKPLILLPPVNDSQGQQMTLLKQHGYCDTAIDWHEFLPIKPINYFAKQGPVLERIHEAIMLTSHSTQAQKKLFELLKKGVERAIDQTTDPLSKLIRDFGHDGIDYAVKNIVGLRNAAPDKKIEYALRQDDKHVLKLNGYSSFSNWNLDIKQSHGSQRLVGSLTMKNESGVRIEAKFEKRMKHGNQGPDTTLKKLKTAGYTHLAHTTRPENLASIFFMNKIVTGESLKKVRFGDRLGSHDRIVGQLIRLGSSTQGQRLLLGAVGYRTPILLFPIDSLVLEDLHINKGYPFGHYITFRTSDGRFFPSFRIDNEITIDELLEDSAFSRSHEVVINAQEISLDALEKLIISSDLKDYVMRIPISPKVKLIFSDPLMDNGFLNKYPLYSKNSKDIVINAVDSNELSTRELKQLLLREVPILGDKVREGILTVQKVVSAIRR